MPTSFRVMTWNVENLFPPGSFISPTSRAPVSEEDFQAKLTFLANVITQQQPDVIALQEIGHADALTALQNRLGGLYPAQAISTAPDSRGIRVAFLARLALTDVVQIREFPAGPLAAVADFNGQVQTKMGRGALQVVVTVADRRIRLINVHLKSKLLTFPRPGGGTAFAPRDEDERAIGAGIAVMRRAAEAVTVRSFVNARLVAEPGTQTIVLGDLNDTPQAATTQLLLGGTPDRDVQTADGGDRVRLYNLMDALPLSGSATHAFLAPGERFTRIHEQQGELIDHLLVSKGLLLNGNEFAVKEVRSFVELIQGQSVTGNPNERAGALAPDHAPVLAHFELR